MLRTGPMDNAWPSGTGTMPLLVRGHDWAATPLGPVEAWPHALRTAVDICLASGFPSGVWWGPDLIQFHNDAALPILRGKHPASFAAPARACWSEVWPVIGPRVERVLATGETAVGEDVVLVPDRGGPREEAWFTFSCIALRDESGAVAGMFITALETTERVRAEAISRESETQSRQLAAKLQYRVRNTLAVVRLMARRTAALAEPGEDWAMHLDDRLGACARVQSALLYNPSAGVDLELLIAEELRAVGAEEGEQVRPIRGPKLRLQAEAAEIVALAIHELATNALKFGALRAEAGRLQVEWRVEEEPEPRLLVTWCETGMRLPDGIPARRGFGSELIERNLPYDLGGRGRLTFERTGLRCEIELPLANNVVAR